MKENGRRAIVGGNGAAFLFPFSYFSAIVLRKHANTNNTMWKKCLGRRGGTSSDPKPSKLPTETGF